MSRLGPSILVIDDEPQIHRFLRPTLRAAGYEVTQALTASDGLLIARRQIPDAVLLDLELPDMDGGEVLAKLRVVSDLPVLIISARDREADKIAALDGGADDYLEKPFAVGELLARLRVALRHRLARGISGIMEFPGLTVDIHRRVAVVAGAPVVMTRREWALLLKLAQNAGHVITHQQLLVSVWGPTHSGDLQYLRVYIAALRQKLGEAGALIGTEVGVGYRMAARLQPQERAT